MQVNVKLRVLRAERGISQMETAAKAQLSQNRYWKIENGYANPTDDEREHIAAVFDVPVTDIFPQAVHS